MDSTSKAAQVADLVMAKDGRDELRRLAEKATPGPWHIVYGDDNAFMCMTAISAKPQRVHNKGAFGDEEELVAVTYHQCYPVVDQDGDDCGDANSAYIAAANPARILSLLDELNEVWSLLRVARKDIGLQALIIQSKNAQITQAEAALAQALATPASPASAPEASERAQFEAWSESTWKYNLLPAREESADTYMDGETETAWMGWQARASLAAPLPPVVARKDGEDAERLDWLDEVNRKANERNRTQYGWKFDINHNRAALTDCNFPVMTIREAIDAARLAGKPDDNGGDANG